MSGTATDGEGIKYSVVQPSRTTSMIFASVYIDSLCDEQFVDNTNKSMELVLQQHSICYPNQFESKLETFYPIEIRYNPMSRIHGPQSSIVDLLDKALTCVGDTYRMYLRADYPFKVNLQYHHLGIAIIPDSICKLQGLISLSVVYCDRVSYPSDILNLKHLRTIRITFSIPPSNHPVAEIPDILYRLTQLRVFDIDANQGIALSHKIGQLTNLETLIFQNGTINQLPDTIQNLTKLEELNINNNGLTALPSWIGKLTNLNRLVLRNNKLIDLPDEIGNCKLLRCLDVANNKLKSLPYRLETLTSLAYLDLSRNQHLRAIPLTVGRFWDLRHSRVELHETMVFEPHVYRLNAALIYRFYVEFLSCLCRSASLEHVILCGLANWKDARSPWASFLSLGMYDPRLFLHVAAFADLDSFLSSIQTSPESSKCSREHDDTVEDELPRKSPKAEPASNIEIVD